MKAFWLLAMSWSISCSFAADALDQWTLAYSGNREARFITYTSGLFIVCGEASTLLTSPDGLTWSPQSVVTNTHLYAVTSDGASNFVAVGGTGSGPVVLRSSDAKSWIPQKITVWNYNGSASTNLAQDVRTPWSVAFADGTFVMGIVEPNYGEDWSRKGSTLFYSRDLTNWHAATPPEPYRAEWEIRAYNVLVPAKVDGIDVIAAAGSIWSPIRLGRPEQPGLSGAWTFQDVASPANGYAQAGAYGNGMFVLIGMEMPTLVSTNGRTWATRIIGERQVSPDPPFDDYTQFNYLVGNGIAFGNGTFVVAKGTPNTVLVSTNGFWKKHPTNIGEGLWSIAYGAGRFVAVALKNIYASPHVSTPGLSIQREIDTPPKLEISGEVGREYLLESSTDLSIWSEADRWKMPLPQVILPMNLSSHGSFYRVSLVR